MTCSGIVEGLFSLFFVAACILLIYYFFGEGLAYLITLGIFLGLFFLEKDFDVLAWLQDNKKVKQVK